MVQRCSVVVLVHGDTDTYTGNGTGMDSGGITDYARRHEEMPASLALELDHIADVVICVDPLATGLAADVHGQVWISRNLLLRQESIQVLFNL